MDDGKNKNRWVRTLDQAGLIDEIEDGWTLEGTAGDPEATIRVSGKGGVSIPPPSEMPSSAAKDRVSVARESALDVAPPDGSPRTPVERHRVSAQVSREPTAAASKPPRSSETSNARATREGILRPSRIPKPPRRSELELELEAELEVLRGAMAERVALGDYSGALEAAERILGAKEEDSEAKLVRDEAQRVLMEMYEAKIGSFDRVPKVAIAVHELIWRNLDSSAGFILSRVDGASSFEDIVDVSGLTRFETCRILCRLLQDGLIR